jgi:protoheme IX farnesyltransferase
LQTQPIATAQRPTSVLRDLIALTKPRINFMVLVTAGGGIALAPQRPDWLTCLAALVGTALVVGSANSLNCYIERNVDKHMTRTMNRPLPAGRLQPRAALILGIVLAAISIPLLWAMVNTLTAFLAAFALISYVAIYTPMKQMTPFALIVGAVPGAMPPLMGWTAATGELSSPGLVLFGILFLWQLPHFLAISLFRESEYTKAGIKVYPATQGPEGTRWHAIAWAIALVPVSLLLGPLGIAGALYTCIALIAGIVFVASCVRHVDAANVTPWGKKVFFTSLVYLPVIFAALALDVALALG